MTKPIIIDFEVQNHEYLNNVGSPFCKDNYIVAVGWGTDLDNIQTRYFYSREESRQDDWIHCLRNTDAIVAHNAAFEIQWLLSEYKDEFLAFLKRGGRVLCTQLAEYLLSNQTDLYPDLNSTAPKYGGTEKIDEVKLLWEQGILTADIDKDLLLEYLGSDHGDIANTIKTFIGQQELLKQRNMMPMYLMRCDALLFNAFCMFNGLKVDMETAYRNKEEQEKRVEELKAKIQKYLPRLPRDFTFKFSSDYHMSAWLYGGVITYDAKVPYDPPKYELRDCYELTDPYYGDKRYIEVKDYHEDNYVYQPKYYTRYKAGKNKGMLKVFRRPFGPEKLKWGKKSVIFNGLINLRKLPAERREKFLGERAEFRSSRFLPNGSPVYSSSKDALDCIRFELPVVEELLELSKLEKDLGTYYLQTKYNPDGTVKDTSGMLKFVEPETHIVHHQLNNCATVTTRLSSSTPNLQNLPRDGTSKVKEMFISRFPNGYVCEIDYTSLEVVDIAAASGDHALLNALINKIDMHCYRLAGALHEDYEEVLKKCKDEEHPEHKKYKELRTAIKPRAFAAQYGASAEGIAFATGCSVKEAKEFLDTEARLFPESRAFANTVVRPQVEETGKLPENLHREVNDAGVWTLYHRGHFESPGGTRYSFRQYPKWVDHQQTMDYKDTQIANYPIQGESAFIVQAACGLVIRWLLKNNFFNNQVLVINTVHDAIYLDCASEELARECSAKVAEIMAYAPKYICKKIPAYEAWNYNTTPFPAVPEYGKNLYEKKGL